MSTPTEQAPREAALFAHLATFDEPCPKCGYSLRHLQSPQCPECGRALRLGVHTAKEPLGWWIAALVGTIPGTGLSAVLAVWLITDLPRHIRQSDAIMMALCLLSLLSCLLLLCLRNRFLGQGKPAQTGWAMLCLAQALAIIVALVWIN